MTSRTSTFFLLLLGAGSLACHPTSTPAKTDDTEDTATGDSTDSGRDSHSADSDTGKDTGDSGETAETGDSETGDTGHVEPPTVDLDEVAALEMFSDERGNQLGLPFVLGDVTGDGIDDACFGADGTEACYGFRSPLPSGLFEIGEAEFTINYSNPDAYPTIGTPGDVNADGVADISIGPFVLLGPIADVESYASADVTILYDTSQYIAYTNQDNPGDSNGDGVDDLLLDLFDPSKKTGEEVLYIFSDVSTPTLTLHDSFGRIHEEYSYSAGGFGNLVSFVGDTNGDGYDDLVYQTDCIVFGPVRYDKRGHDANIDGAAYIRAAGDVNGDGYTDILAHYWRKTGEVGIFEGPIADGTTDWESHDVSINVRGWTDADAINGGVNTGDLNGDGRSDIAFEYTARDSGFYGDLYVFETPLEGALTDADAAYQLQSSRYDIYFGDMDGPGNLDGGEVPDFLVGDQYYGGFIHQGGAGWMIRGEDLP